MRVILDGPIFNFLILIFKKGNWTILGIILVTIQMMYVSKKMHKNDLKLYILLLAI